MHVVGAPPPAVVLEALEQQCLLIDVVQGPLEAVVDRAEVAQVVPLVLGLLVDLVDAIDILIFLVKVVLALPEVVPVLISKVVLVAASADLLLQDEVSKVDLEHPAPDRDPLQVGHGEAGRENKPEVN